MRLSARTLFVSPGEQQFPVVEVKQHPQAGVRVVAVVGAASLAMLVDGTANATFGIGLPYVQGAAATTPDESSWVLTAFNAPYYATILFTPWLYARFGRKPLLLGSLIGYTIVSLLLSEASSFDLIVGLRFMQGICLGGVFVPAAILLFTSLPLAALTLAIPGFALLSLGAGTLGTLIGGYYSETYGAWAIYLPSALATLVSAIVIWFNAPSHDQPQKDLQPDIIGFGFSLLAFGAMQYLTNEAERRNWFDDWTVPFAITILVTAVAAFLIWELLLCRRPHANLHLFAQYRNLSVGGCINVILGGVGYSVTVFTTYLQSAIAASATLAGEMIALRLATYTIGIAAAFLLVSRRLLDVRVLVGLAAVGSSLTLYSFSNSMTATATAGNFVMVTLLFGLFFSMMSQPVPSLVIGALPLDLLPAGLSVYKLTAPLGLMAATTFVSSFLDRRAALHATQLAASLNRSRVPVTDFLRHGGTLKSLAGLATNQAQVLAFQDAMSFLAILVLLVIPLVLLVNPQARRP
jgi:DHA2 family multidrug resistance protein